ncbi:MAG: DUF1559 domain-containing protein [Gemmataceae bacterium]
MVILLILVVAGGIVTIGIGNVREAAASMQCQNNLKQLGIAIHGYCFAYDRLPPLVDQGQCPNWPRAAVRLRHPDAIPRSDPGHLRPHHLANYYHAHSSVKIIYSEEDDAITVQGGMANYLSTRFRIRRTPPPTTGSTSR